MWMQLAWFCLSIEYISMQIFLTQYEYILINSTARRPDNTMLRHQTLHRGSVVHPEIKPVCGHVSLAVSLQWRHNEHDGVSFYRRPHCLLNRLSRCRSKKTSKLRVTGLCAGNSPVTGDFSAQKASTAENVSIWWRHHVRRYGWYSRYTGHRHTEAFYIKSYIRQKSYIRNTQTRQWGYIL